MTTSVLKAGMKNPSLQRLTLSRPMNQSGEGTIFVITDIWEIIVETMILISHRQTMLWLASTKTLVEVFPTPWTIGGAKMESKKLRLLDAWSRAWGGQSLRPQYDEFLFWLFIIYSDYGIKTKYAKESSTLEWFLDYESTHFSEMMTIMIKLTSELPVSTNCRTPSSTSEPSEKREKDSRWE